MRLEYYSDTSTYNERNNYTLMLDTPIQMQQNEYLEVKVVDLSFLNDNYNISSNLQNNKISVTNENRVYYITPGAIVYNIFENNDFFSGGGHNLANNVTREHFDGYEVLTNEDYKLYYYRSDITEAGGATHYNQQVFTTDATSHSIPLIQATPFHLVLEDINNNNNLLHSVYYKLKYNGGVTQNTTITLKIAYSNDGINYTDFGSTNTYISTAFPGFTSTSEITATHNPAQVSLYYKIYYDSDVPLIDGQFEITNLLYRRVPFSIGNNSSITTTDIIIPDGFYNKTNFISTINTLLETYNHTFSVSNITNKLTITNNNTPYVFSHTDLIENNRVVTFTLHNNLIKRMLGLNNNTYTIPQQTNIESDDILNLLHYQKLIITTDLTFNQATKHDLRDWKQDNSQGLRNILLWCPVDEPPFSVIKYNNYENVSYIVDDKIIKNINFYFYNEFKQPVDIKRILFHIQLEKKNITYK